MASVHDSDNDAIFGKNLSVYGGKASGSPPLWEVIDRAWWSSVDTEDPHCSPPASDQAAYVIRAVADWIEKRQVEDYVVTLPDVREVIGWLRDEADRAERGETINPSENV